MSRNGIIKVVDSEEEIKSFEIKWELFSHFRSVFFKLSIDNFSTGEYIVLDGTHIFYCLGLKAGLLWPTKVYHYLLGDINKIVDVLNLYKNYPTIKVLLVDGIK